MVSVDIKEVVIGVGIFGLACTRGLSASVLSTFVRMLKVHLAKAQTR